MRGNCGDDGKVMHGDNMGAFDQLPKALRQALANADHNWSARMVLQLRRRKATNRIGGMPVSFETTAGAIAALHISDTHKHRKDAAAGIVCGDQR